MKHLIIFLLFASGMGLTNCKSTENFNKNQEVSDHSDRNEVTTTIVSLTELLRTKPGVMVTGSGKNATIKIRTGATSFLGDSTPLFVLNGQVVNGGYSNLFDLVLVPDIKKLKILTDPADLSLYGSRAANGVIEIETKY